MDIEQVKVVMIGEARVGKSSILTRYVANNFQPHSTPTLGAAYQNRVVKVKNQTVKLNIWDTAGQERYNSLAKSYSRDAKIVVLVYDITNRSSYETMKRWHETLKDDILHPDCIYAVFGNKEDLLMDEEVPLDEVHQFAMDIKAIFKKTSAKNNIGIEEGFFELSEKILKMKKKEINTSYYFDKQTSVKNIKKRKCC
jgi:small GTP-binding protein